MRHWYDFIQQGILTHAGEWWTYAITTLLCWIDGFFPPLPSESIVIGMAALAETHGGPVRIWILMPLAILGAFAGDNTAYWIGRRVPLQRLFRGEKGAARLARVHELIHRKGAEVLLSARFIPGYRILVNMTAGGVRLPYRRFMMIDAISTLMWACFSVGIGLAAGSVFHDKPLLGITVGVLCGLLVGWIIERVSAYRSARRERAEQEARVD